MPDQIKVLWTPSKLRRFKAVLEIETRLKHSFFIFGGNEYYVPYARYLVEYLETILHKDKE